MEAKTKKLKEGNQLTGLLKKVKQLESKSSSLKLLLEHLQNRYDHLAITLESTKIQLQSLALELARLNESIQDSLGNISPDILQEIVKIKNPNTTLVNFCITFQTFFNIPSASWVTFKELLKDFKTFQEKIMKNSLKLKPEDFRAGKYFLTTFTEISLKLKKYPKGVRLLRVFLRSLIEKSLTEKSQEDCLDEYSSYKSKLLSTSRQISRVNLEISETEEKLFSLHPTRVNSSEKPSETEPTEPLNSPIFTQRVKVHFDFHASGGLLSSQKSLVSDLPFMDLQVEPFFNSESKDLYSTDFESNERLGCCRSGLFCFL